MRTLHDTVKPAVREVTLKSRDGGERNPRALAFLIALWFALLFAILFLLTLITTTCIDGSPFMNSTLLTAYSSSDPLRAGARPAILGSMWVIGTTAVMAILAVIWDRAAGRQ